MSKPGAPDEIPPPRSLRSLVTPGLVILALTTSVWAQQQSATPPNLAPDLSAAMAKADAGDPSALTALADSGRADAQFYAAVMYVSGRGGIARDGAKGCAYAEKASASRGDAAFMVGQCYQQGLGGQPDAARAKAAYARADQMGFQGAKCALGKMQMAEPGQGAQGLQLCKDAAKAGDVAAQTAVGDAYRSGGPVKADPGEARKWYDMAAKQKDPRAAQELGEMYAKGEGGKRDTKKALELWKTAEAGGNPLVCILVADQLFSDMTGGKTPGPGKYAFKGGIPVADVETVEAWYKEALQRDPRPDIQQRAKYALAILASIKSAAKSVPDNK
jgi:TPR repeat protein